MNRRFTCFIAITLCLLLVVAPPAALGGSLKFTDIEKHINSGQPARNTSELRLRSERNTSTAPIHSENAAVETETISGSSLVSMGEADNLSECSGPAVETMDLCDVSGTVCEDCGEIVLVSDVAPAFAEVTTPGAGFPTVLVFSLAAVPLALLPFLRNNNGPETDTPRPPFSIDTPPIPNPTPVLPPGGPQAPTSPVPEPGTLMLLGSGLAALMAAAHRRRRINLVAKLQGGER